MLGYAATSMGYPSNMQPALAILSDYDLPNGKNSWTVFNNRTVKPNYQLVPNWNIIPRN
jgi:hypothetical protein